MSEVKAKARTFRRGFESLRSKTKSGKNKPDGTTNSKDTETSTSSASAATKDSGYTTFDTASLKVIHQRMDELDRKTRETDQHLQGIDQQLKDLRDECGSIKEFAFEKMNAIESAIAQTYSNIKSMLLELNQELLSSNKRIDDLDAKTQSLKHEQANFATKSGLEDVRYIQKFFEEKLMMQRNHEYKKYSESYFKQNADKFTPKSKTEKLAKAFSKFQEDIKQLHSDSQEDTMETINSVKQQLASLEMKLTESLKSRKQQQRMVSMSKEALAKIASTEE